MDKKYEDWFEGFRTIVSEKLGTQIYDDVMNDCMRCKSVKSDLEMATCIKQLMENFDNVVEEKDKRGDVMETMGYYCFQNHFLQRALKVKAESKGIEEIIKNLNQIIGEEEFFTLKENIIEAKFDKCYCHIGVQVAEENLPKTYCYCSLGWLKDLFKILLEKDVKVDMLQTIVSGGDACEFIIHLD
ncbi:MAG: hypothetical protein EU552_02135 [Promethearchaeota archaeon]|nr:MAG: hypothetical protein EU552_02135 [Candidatus Lokiarchaeota archaeon]